MGLDIKVKKCADLAAAKAAEEAGAQASGKHWSFGGNRYEELTQEEKDQARAKDKAYREANGLDEYGGHKSIESIGDDVVSKIDPEHMFKIDYFRSSYNGSGFESVMRKLGLPTLKDIFQQDEHYEFAPDWDDALIRVNDAIVRYESHLNGPAGKEDWHLTALKIVRESIEYVISQPDRDHYFLQWSA